MRDLIALAYEISKTEGTEQKHHEVFCKAIKDELLHMEATELAEILTCAVDTKNRECIVTLKISLAPDEINATSG